MCALLILFQDFPPQVWRSVALKNRSQVCSDQFMDSRGKIINANNKMQLTL